MAHGQVLSPYNFDRQIMERFGDRWDEAWTEALDVIDESSPRDLQKGPIRLVSKARKAA